MRKHKNLTDALSCLDRKAAELTALVLISQNIEVLWQEQNGRVDLIIDDAVATFAWDTLSRFYVENHIPPENSTGDNRYSHGDTHTSPFLPPITWQGKTTAAVACLVLCTIHAATAYYGNHHQVVLTHGASALYILMGEYERSITALMLHADFLHLAGNVLGLMVLGSVICSLFGPGRGLFLILFSGAAGNLLNAFMYRRVHLSIGASTAVMGAVGILTAWQLRKKVHITLKPSHGIDITPSALYPLGAGAALVGMFSGGENTDVSAHVFGFLAGLGGAILFFQASRFWKQCCMGKHTKILSTHGDSFFLIIVIAVVFVSWIKG